MLKIITSVVLSLVTIMAVTLFAVTVPAQSQKIDDNTTYIKTVDDALENVQEWIDTVQLYKHTIDLGELTYSSSGTSLAQHYYIEIIDNNEQAYTASTVPNMIYIVNYETNNSGALSVSSYNIPFWRKQVTSQYTYGVVVITSGSAIAATSFTDTVTQIF